VERRLNYIQLLHEQLGEEHPFIKLVCQCLHNNPAERPSVKMLLKRLEGTIIRCSSGEASIGDVRKTSNGCEVARRVRKEKTGFRLQSGNIAAIDFGNTYLCVAYTTATTVGMRSEDPQRLILNRMHYHIPTTILFKPDGSIDSVGYDARAEYLNLDDKERLIYAYFEEILHDKVFIQTNYFRSDK